MKGTKTIFYFNFIDKSIEKNQMDEIKSLHRFYQKRNLAMLESMQTFQTIQLNLSCNLSSCCIRYNSRWVTLSPIVLGTKSEAGVLLKTYGDIKKL